MGVTSFTNNKLNQVTGTAGGGPLEFSGTVDKPSPVTVGGVPAEVDFAGNFRGSAVLGAGTSVVPIVATDASGNIKTNNYQVVVPSVTPRTLTYDLNGNMTNDGNGKAYAWDAANRLVKITYGSSGSTEFSYDGSGRRTKIVEKNGSGTVTSDLRFLWNGLKLSEERNSSNSVTKRFYGQGVHVIAATAPADKLFYARDHLGSIRELTDSIAAVRGRWDYDSYGRRSSNLITSGALEADFAYTGHYFHSRSNLTVAPFRIYDADLERWLSRDPIAESGGINLYGYVGNDPVNSFDPFGLVEWFHNNPKIIIVKGREQTVIFGKTARNRTVSYTAVSGLYNCHGNTFANARGWIGGEDAAKILEDEYEATSDPKPTDVVAYYKDGALTHTALVSGENAKGETLVQSKPGDLPLQSGKTVSEAAHPLPASDYGTPKYFKLK